MKKITRITAFILAAIMTFAYLPQVVVFANTQRNIEDLRIESGALGTVILSWDRPPATDGIEGGDATNPGTA